MSQARSATMHGGDEGPTWHIEGASARGVMHSRDGEPNQDAWGRWRGRIGSSSVALGAVADGHGSLACPRSHVGARLAIRAVREVVEEVCESGGTNDLAETLAERLPGRLVDRWRELVADDLRRAPLEPQEWSAVEEKSLMRAREVALDPARAYGTTLVAAVAVGERVVVVQIGDGGCLVAESAEHVQSPVPGDERLIAHETTSLCSEGAEEAVRTVIVEAPQGRDRLVMLCTDGVSDAFVRQAGFLQLGGDLWREVCERGGAEVARDLPEWVEGYSRDATADDATLCFLFSEAIRTESEANEASEAAPDRCTERVEEPAGPAEPVRPVRSGADGLCEKTVELWPSDDNEEMQ